MRGGVAAHRPSSSRPAAGRPAVSPPMAPDTPIAAFAKMRPTETMRDLFRLQIPELSRQIAISFFVKDKSPYQDKFQNGRTENQWAREKNIPIEFSSGQCYKPNAGSLTILKGGRLT
ncbi:hypothetical protein QZM22_10505 [Burkholderia oklahomensis]|uniref:hypothetical protein n=1 Tax=Burkholderia oklahomensis TaxID=342113 RepID=UPI002651B467|nr:hypothetical protein [Burkholderia oklahomensis]MDN7672944.1 hypothetical protein [Burkholderia oklahomensis]